MCKAGSETGSMAGSETGLETDLVSESNSGPSLEVSVSLKLGSLLSHSKYY